MRACQRNFAIVKPYFGQVPIYPGVQWSWTAVSDELDPTAIDEITVLARLKGFADQLRVYNPGLHRAAFAMPTYLRRLLELDHEPDSADLRALGHPLPGVVD